MRPEKESIVQEYRDQVKGSEFLFLADNGGMTVEQMSGLRKDMRTVEARVQVLKNRLFKQLVAEIGVPELEGGLKGPTAMVTGAGDVVETAKMLKGYIKKNDLPSLKLGALLGRFLSAQDIDDLAGLPPREELLAKVVGTIAAPMTQTVGVLNQKVLTLLYVLQAIQEKKQTS